ncbi:WXG100 family type VII secretion target [Yinghuangia sp. YIM S09857]|uniref:WXG100 family type VII secretion target n=1 Tax=Yinghuangia sp. YIM S09857 TaxID=3436929 RepID=UPI003F52A188
MAGSFKATTEQLDALAKKIDSEQAAIQGQITRFNGIVDFVQAGWQGDAFRAFDTLQDRVNVLLTQLNQQLDDIGVLMGKGAVNYAQTEEANKAQISQITSALG